MTLGAAMLLISENPHYARHNDETVQAQYEVGYETENVDVERRGLFEYRVALMLAVEALYPLGSPHAEVLHLSLRVLEAL